LIAQIRDRNIRIVAVRIGNRRQLDAGRRRFYRPANA
jgi:hypothetical protein